MSLLDYACLREYNDSNLNAALQVIKVIYDAHPEAIESNEIASDIPDYHHHVQAFLNGQLVYSRQAQDHHLMTTPDEKGQLPLHSVLRNKICLGSIKLLVNGNLSALRVTDNSGTIPLHVLCQHHESASVVDYLLDADSNTFDSVDREGNTALHYACRGAKYDTITLLLEKYDNAFVSAKNGQKKLPIDLLFGSDAVSDGESVEHVETIFRLIKAYPDTVMNML